MLLRSSNIQCQLTTISMSHCFPSDCRFASMAKYNLETSSTRHTSKSVGWRDQRSIILSVRGEIFLWQLWKEWETAFSNERKALCDLSVSSIVGDAFFSFKWVSDRCHSRPDEKTSMCYTSQKNNKRWKLFEFDRDDTRLKHLARLISFAHLLLVWRSSFSKINNGVKGNG